MQYLLLLYHNEKEFQAFTQEERGKLTQEYFTLIDDLNERGQYLGGNPLEATTTAKTVRVRDDKPVVTDGPFAETKEQLAGYFLVEVKDESEAAGIAARIPAARRGAVEVRRVPPLPPRP
ncbi:MAG TPA: YciI family protein [Bryobacteraceae bacterium]|nr:YciI family protein [Bryobacteraceae bacterium]